jgi:hypothetical protein
MFILGCIAFAAPDRESGRRLEFCRPFRLRTQYPQLAAALP